MSDVPDSVDWSPADHPYAIAVSEAMWWRCAVQLAAARLGDDEDLRVAPVSSRQLDARNMVFALAQLLGAERLEQQALHELGIDAAVGLALVEARERFLAAVPNIVEIRNALTHFDEWAIGRGRGAQRQSVDSGAGLREVASHYWSFGFYPSENALRLGPFTVPIEVAVEAAVDLARAVGAAAMEVDRIAADRDRA